jgi:carbamoyl-phosphate synthase large subunit
VVRKHSEAQETGDDSIVDIINRSEVDVVINTPSGRSARADGYEIRAAAVAADKPLFTTIAELSAAVASLDAIREGFDVKSLQEYALDRAARA